MEVGLWLSAIIGLHVQVCERQLNINSSLSLPLARSTVFYCTSPF